MDFFGFALPVTGEGFSVTPWFMYGKSGKDSGYWNYATGDDNYVTTNNIKDDTAFWFAGGAFELDILDPFALKLDTMYGVAKGDDALEFSSEGVRNFV
jgi:hypothetical protein